MSRTLTNAASFRNVFLSSSQRCVCARCAAADGVRGCSELASPTAEAAVQSRYSSLSSFAGNPRIGVLRASSEEVRVASSPEPRIVVAAASPPADEHVPAAVVVVGRVDKRSAMHFL